MILENGQKITANVKRANGYERRDAIRDWALGEFQRIYKDDTIGKEDIFITFTGYFTQMNTKHAMRIISLKCCHGFLIARTFGDFLTRGEI